MADEKNSYLGHMKYIKIVKATFVPGLKYIEAIGYNRYDLMLLT